MPLFGVHNLNNSCIPLSYSPRRNIKERKPVARTQSAPHRRPGHAKHNLKRQTSSEDLTIADHGQEMAINQPHITSPKTVSTKRNYEDSLGYFYLVKKSTCPYNCFRKKKKTFTANDCLLYTIILQHYQWKY